MSDNYKLETMGGNQFRQVAEKAKQIAETKKCIVEFEFNEITCLVSEKTVLDWLERDYMNAFIMEWKTVGDDCRMMYDSDTEIELRSRQLERAKRRKVQQEQQDLKDRNQQNIVAEKVKGEELNIVEGTSDEYKKYVEINSDNGYGQAVIDYGEAWAKLMQIEIAKGQTIEECAEATQKDLGYLGITGFQYGCVVQGLAHFWKYGNELRKWHNKQYGVSEDKEGTVNPAIMTIG